MTLTWPDYFSHLIADLPLLGLFIWQTIRLARARARIDDVRTQLLELVSQLQQSQSNVDSLERMRYGPPEEHTP